MPKLAFIVSHPIQYYVPLYRLLAMRDDIEIIVFFTWHGGESAQLDHGFGKPVAWDIPLKDGYAYEVVPNTASRPGTHHFWGLRNPSLIRSVLDWRPDAIHVTGYAYASHLRALHAFRRHGVPVLFRGDSHLLDERTQGLRWGIKRFLLATVYSWPSAFLCVGKANRAYYQAFKVPEARLFHCPHSVEVERFAQPNDELECQAEAWRRELGIPPETVVLLFAGKFEEKKRVVPLMQAVLDSPSASLALVLVGDGEHGVSVRQLAGKHPRQCRVLPFQNQSRMPVVYRLGDLFVLPSAHGETWGLAVNEAMACGRPVLVSDKVGCAQDLVEPGINGDVFPADDWPAFLKKLATLARELTALRRMGFNARRKANDFTVRRTAQSMLTALRAVLSGERRNSCV